MTKVIGLTGGIAAGKSTVAKMFKKLGAEIIDADQIAHEIIDTQEDLLLELVNHFGNGILNENGKLNRKELGKIVFSNKIDKELLESITHPAIIKEATNRIIQFAETDSDFVIYEAALLIETGHYKEMDFLITVIADDDLRMKRLMKRNSLSFEDAKKKLDSQMPQDRKAWAADYIIDNSGDLEITEKMVKNVWEKLCQ